MTIFDELYKFIGNERFRFENRDDNIFGTSIAQVIRYREFLDIISSRYYKLSKIFIQTISNHRKISGKHGNGPISQELMDILSIQRAVSNELQLEIESFYQFSKILLDRVVGFFDLYFGQIDNVSYGSHNKFYKPKSISSFLSSFKDINKVIESAEILTKIIIDFRDDHIVHKPCSRDTYAVLFNLTHQVTQISKNRIFPNENDTQINSENIYDLLIKIDDYLRCVIEFINCNQEKTVLKLK